MNNQLYKNDMFELRIFIKDMELINVLVIGSKFTWFSLNGKVMSRLDRFLLSKGMIGKWKVVDQVIGSRGFFDHCLIWIKGKVTNRGLKPFKYFNCWIQHP